MNAKTAKKLRKIAKQMATQELVYTPQGNSGRFVLEVAPAKIPADLVGMSGNIPLPGGAVGQQPKVIGIPGTVQINDQSERGIYNMLKKAAQQ
jgi:hypothetical protein